ncbi:MaoC/PaaZ C-terminal domain-containing protein [Patulibacter defluvii]|uniref:MaoC/PaaZ C-terminal domain-containing protein n=1 Tax=Patulibacter defluvii TaxID=3095358 RepID=UPI002A76332B|nr:MaoC/PaaZ C-terminal domain-containing protein [Patulibacter sp. DM4]
MGLAADAVGRRARPWSGVVDGRWLMAYAAGLGHAEDVYFDTTRAPGVVAHPVFPIAPEWALLTQPESGLDLGLSVPEALRGVHAGHDLHQHRPIVPDRPITVEAQVVGVERAAAGARTTTRFDGRAEDGTALWTSWMRTVYRGVAVDGEERPPADAPPPPVAADEQPDRRVRGIAIDVAAPHVYGECARIWNPIHSDRAIARAVGLDGPILHGSATLAHAVDEALTALGAGPRQVRRLGAGFRSAVAVPSAIAVVVTATGRQADGDRLARFEVREESGGVVLRDGFLVVGE